MGSGLFKQVEPFNMVKVALLNLEAKDASRWSSLVDEYLTDKFPRLSGGMRPVNFELKDPETGSAIGSCEYRDSGVSLTIPIFISEWKLKDPDIALHGSKVVPLDVDMISSLRNKSQMTAKIVDNPKGEDMTEQSEFISSLFDTNETDTDGNPMYVKSAKETVEKVAKAYNDLFKPDQILPESAQKFIKNAKSIYEREDILKLATVERADKPYHYDCDILKRAGLSIKYEHISALPEIDVQKLGEKTVKESEWVSFDPETVAPPAMKEITESGTYSIPLGAGVRRAHVFMNTFSIEGVSKKRLKPLTILDDGRYDNCTPIINGQDEAPDYKEPKQLNNGPAWSYGKVYGTSEATKFKGEGKSTGTWVDNIDKMEDPQGLLNKTIVFYVPENRLSSPYVVEKVDDFMLGSKKNREVVLHLMSLASKSRISCWMGCEVNYPIKGNKDKMRTNQFSPISDTRYPLWLIPSLYEVRILRGEEIEPTMPKKFYNDYFDGEMQDYDHELTVETNGLNPKKVDIEIKAEGKNPEVYESLDKVAADLHIQYFMGNENIGVKDLYIGESYKLAKKDKAPMLKIATANAFDEYRGEWVKLAYVMMKDKNIKEFFHDIEKSADNLDLLTKLGDLESMVDDIIGLEYVDNDNIGDTSHVESAVEDTIDKLGQLLLIARMGKNNIPENILMRAIQALTKVLKEIRGSVSREE